MDRREGGDRRKRWEFRTWVIGAALGLAVLIFFAASYVNASRQRDLLTIACQNAVGHRDLTLAVAVNTQLTNDIAAKLGLPIRPVRIKIPHVPPECASF